MLLDTTRRFIAERYGFDYRHRVRGSDKGSRDPRSWLIWVCWR